MPFSVPTLDEIHQVLLDDFANRLRNANVSRFSDNWKRLRVVALGISGLHAHALSVEKDCMPDTASGDRLDRWGDIYALERKGATPAKKADAGRLVGTVSTAFTSGAQLVSTDGLLFKVNESGSIPGAGYIDVDIVAISTGSATRKSAGTVLTFVTPISGIESNVELQKDLDEDGTDIEDPGAYRNRILDRIAMPPMGGNAQDYRAWALEVTGIDTAFVFPGRNGLGSVDLVAFHSGSGSVRILSAQEITDLKAHIDALRPVSVADFRVLSTTAEPNNVEVLISPEDDATYAFDWNDQTPLEVSSVSAGTREITFTANTPTDLTVGKRITYKSTSGSYGTGAELVVEALPAANKVKVNVWPANPPVSGNLVYSGGPLVELIRQDILALIDSLGPARGTYAAAGMLWEGTLRTSSIFKVAQTRKGVLDSSIAVPGANVTPANSPPTSSVGIITPRQILVRRWW